MHMYCVQPDGTRKEISDKPWAAVDFRGLAFHKDRLFGIYQNSLVEIKEDDYSFFSGDYSKFKTLTEVNNSLYSFDDYHKRLYKISIPSNEIPTKTAVGNYRISPSIAAGIPPKYLFLVENGVYHTMDVQTGQGKKLTGKGNPSAAVYCYGYLFIIDVNGDIWTLNPDTGEEVYRITTGAKFRGSKDLACYQGNLWAIGKDHHMYEIDPTKLNKVTQKGTLTYTNTSPMTSYSGKA